MTATQYYKVLKDGQSFHGGELTWSLPTQGEDGAWTPGEWHDVEGEIVVCNNGLHLTSEPAKWMSREATVYAAEYSGDTDTDGDDKIAVQRARLLRPATDGELAALRIFSGGEHRVVDGVAWASGSATVEASGSATVEASGSATVWAYDSATVEASGSATVWASDSATVRAFGSATVRAFDSATVLAFGSATVTSTQWHQANVQTSDAAVWIDRRQSPPRIIVGGVEYMPEEAAHGTA